MDITHLQSGEKSSEITLFIKGRRKISPAPFNFYKGAIESILTGNNTKWDMHDP